MTRRPLYCILALSAALAACAPDRALAPGAAPAAALTAARKPAAGITVALDVQPDAHYDVPFITTGRSLGAFTLDDDADPALANSVTFAKARPGTYTVQPGAVVGVAQQGVACVSDANGGTGTDNNTVDPVTRVVTIRLEKGEVVTCTFTALSGWQAGDFVTRTQLTWGNPFATNPTLFGGYDVVYQTSVVEVGIPGAAGFSMAFTLPLAVTDYLPATGLPAPLTQDLVNPTATVAGALGGEVLALQLNVDFADAGVTLGTAGLAFGDLTLCGLGAPADGLSVRQFLALANTALGGGSTSGSSLYGHLAVAEELNGAFGEGNPTQFARDNLVAGACP